MPERFAEALHRVYIALFDELLATLVWGAQTPTTVRADSTAEDLDRWLKALSFGLPGDALDGIAKLFPQIERFADANVARSVPGISPEQLLPRFSLDALRRAQVGRIKQATMSQVSELRELVQSNQGMPVRELSQLIQDRIGVSKNKSKLWARDQVLKFNASVTKERHLQLGIQEYYWITSRDERVRERHQELAGRKFKYEDPPKSDSGEPINPGEDYQCRCTALPATASAGVLSRTAQKPSKSKT